ncbi:MAG: DUF2480 family protein [Edaphocola sp.]
MEATIVNKVADSGIVTLSLEQFLPGAESMALFDIKPFLFQEMILREKDFREAMTAFDWRVFDRKNVAVTCTADAIVPMWAYMLVAARLQPYASSVTWGSMSDLDTALILKGIENFSAEALADKRVVIKGCGNRTLPEAAYLAISLKLLPLVKSLMYGEPCSTVPVYKKK